MIYSCYFILFSLFFSSNPDLTGQDQEDGIEVNKKISKKT